MPRLRKSVSPVPHGGLKAGVRVACVPKLPQHHQLYRAFFRFDDGKATANVVLESADPDSGETKED